MCKAGNRGAAGFLLDRTDSQHCQLSAITGLFYRREQGIQLVNLGVYPVDPRVYFVDPVHNGFMIRFQSVHTFFESVHTGRHTP